MTISPPCTVKKREHSKVRPKSYPEWLSLMLRQGWKTNNNGLYFNFRNAHSMRRRRSTRTGELTGTSTSPSVFVFVFTFILVVVVVFLLVRSYLLISLIRCVKGVWTGTSTTQSARRARRTLSTEPSPLTTSAWPGSPSSSLSPSRDGQTSCTLYRFDFLLHICFGWMSERKGASWRYASQSSQWMCFRQNNSCTGRSFVLELDLLCHAHRHRLLLHDQPLPSCYCHSVQVLYQW